MFHSLLQNLLESGTSANKSPALQAASAAERSVKVEVISDHGVAAMALVNQVPAALCDVIVIGTVLEAAPVLGAIFSVIGAIAQTVLRVVYNRYACELLSKRVQSLEDPLRAIQSQLGSVATSGQLSALELLQSLLDDMLELVRAYTTMHWVKQGLGSRSFHTRFELFDSSVDKVMADLQVACGNLSTIPIPSSQVGLSAEVLRRTQLLLEQGRVVMVLDTKLDDLLAELKQQSEMIHKQSEMIQQQSENIQQLLSDKKGNDAKSDGMVIKQATLRMNEIAREDVLFQFGRGKDARLGTGANGDVFRVLYQNMEMACKVSVCVFQVSCLW
jgi:hypothetical protein